MTDEFVAAAARSLADHGAFERIDGGFAVTTTPFDATVTLTAADGAVRYDVTVRAPTLNAVVRGEEVAGVIREGWFETLERRLEDVDGVTRFDADPPAVRLDADEVVIETGVVTADPAGGAADVRALVGFVEGTYFQGVIPGYDYREPVAGLLDRAQSTAGSESP